MNKSHAYFTGALLAATVIAPHDDVSQAKVPAPIAMLAGVNLSGAEFNGGKSNARLNFDYVYPTEAEISWAASHHMTAVRLPVEWARLQPVLNAPINSTEWRRVIAVVHMARVYHIRVILDLHDYGAWRGLVVGSRALPDSVFADTWSRLATLAGSEPDMILGLMNEPHLQTSSQWEKSAQAALNAIRAANARNLVLVSGSAWDGAHSWTSGGPASNATAMDHLTTPGSGPVAFELHQYFDHDFSGTKPDCLSPADAVRTLQPATAWLEAGHHQGFLGEFATTATPPCLTTLDAVLTYLDVHRDQWIGWTYWTAGGWWGNYMFSVEPSDGKEKPQMSVLSRHLP